MYKLVLLCHLGIVSLDHAGVKTKQLFLLVYWSGFLLLWTFGQFENSLLNLKYIFPQAFEETASSSGGKLSVNDNSFVQHFPDPIATNLVDELYFFHVFFIMYKFIP